MEHTKNSRTKQPTILGEKINRTKFRNDQILELSDNKFKITKNNMLNFLVENEDKMHEQMENFSRDGNYNNKPKGNAKAKKHNKRGKECLQYTHQ